MIFVVVAGLELAVIFGFIAQWQRRRGNKIGFWIGIVLAGITVAACVPIIILLVALLTGPGLRF